jgi:hypothetical protein
LDNFKNSLNAAVADWKNADSNTGAVANFASKYLGGYTDE